MRIESVAHKLLLINTYMPFECDDNSSNDFADQLTVMLTSPGIDVTQYC